MHGFHPALEDKCSIFQSEQTHQHTGDDSGLVGVSRMAAVFVVLGLSGAGPSRREDHATLAEEHRSAQRFAGDDQDSALGSRRDELQHLAEREIAQVAAQF